jgi:hypothetical protein
VRTAAVVVTWEGGAVTDRCVASLHAQDTPPAEVVVVDNGSGASERARLRRTYGDARSVRLLLLEENRQFAGGLNAGVAAARAAGADRFLLLNNDTVLAPDALRLLGAALDAAPRAGIAGPRVLDLARRGRVLSAGERHVLPLLCVPRTLIRYRRRSLEPYGARGVMGCAMLVTRACFESPGDRGLLRGRRLLPRRARAGLRGGHRAPRVRLPRRPAGLRERAHAMGSVPEGAESLARDAPPRVRRLLGRLRPRLRGDGGGERGALRPAGRGSHLRRPGTRDALGHRRGGGPAATTCRRSAWGRLACGSASARCSAWWAARRRTPAS